MDTLGAFLIHRFARDRDGRVELAGATDDMRSLIAQVGECDQPAKIRPDTRPPLARILTDMGRATMAALKVLVAFVEFFGQTMVAVWELVRNPLLFRVTAVLYKFAVVAVKALGLIVRQQLIIGIVHSHQGTG